MKSGATGAIHAGRGVAAPDAGKFSRSSSPWCSSSPSCGANAPPFPQGFIPDLNQTLTVPLCTFRSILEPEAPPEATKKRYRFSAFQAGHIRS